ncbi:uncharacterized protein EV422DRAFT_320737 [Fimicolochytrium jonesii]|uniref:uncharacterized protein n=1 Tax=Fimicolochytrium jonesii TaxID=1396493 RepID=UPI0022FEE492|nr:uncharacterized protein EV422DRAFT_320737 [Fimicolochytrium jonesii]KAI8824443.1 hypothetical protein EV422DRAFT_320737 [Fimicolochytrium jonesii]
MSVCLWVLGIGDRHANNWMVTPEGFVIAINFDLYMSRGAMSYVPEVLPIRLTPQVRNAIHEPTFRAIMTAVLPALGAKPDRLAETVNPWFLPWTCLEFPGICRRIAESACPNNLPYDAICKRCQATWETIID